MSLDNEKREKEYLGSDSLNQSFETVRNIDVSISLLNDMRRVLFVRRVGGLRMKDVVDVDDVDFALVSKLFSRFSELFYGGGSARCRCRHLFIYLLVCILLIVFDFLFFLSQSLL